MSNYYRQPSQARRPIWPVLLTVALLFGALFCGLSYISQRLEARKERQAYWQKQLIAQSDRSVTLIEGWNSQQIAEKLASSQLGFTTDDFLQIAGRPRQNYQSLPVNQWPHDFSQSYGFLADKPKNRGLEGYLFADTYRFRPSSSPIEVVEKMLDNFDRQLNTKMRQDIAKQGKTIYQIVTMASLIEKEVRSEKDMQIVSGIFWRRLADGQRLESCATLAYILGENKPQYSYKETRIESPYNTYLNSGLPPGPICSPSLKAIKAAIYPIANNYNFFLTRPDNGQTVFSRTFDEHKVNKAKYLK